MINQLISNENANVLFEILQISHNLITDYLLPKDLINLSCTCKKLPIKVRVQEDPRNIEGSYVEWRNSFVTGDDIKFFRSFSFPISVPLFPINDKKSKIESGQKSYYKSKNNERVTSELHSISFSFNWMNQGYGSRKGELFMTARRKLASDQGTNPSDSAGGFDESLQIWKSPYVDTTWKNLSWSYTDPCPESIVYEMWYKTGGGGGHQLKLKNFKFFFLVLSTSEVRT
eukprot:CAMPEP_0178957274 /NCGR_PEP_ID=MMETSP0789-20121207/10802_1 /TAXON_ID=3005 /ORGANISM="Rhizosolenia setigera, Strain CCMP 1694" /LENGTH=228 /DNA_ID=CAMNT_0020639463 /DNA_START=32 /DNA_END=718 /DNA_ORIENTATION=+